VHDSPDLDRLLPVFDLRSLVALTVPGPRHAAYRALRGVALEQVPLLRCCLRLRALPERLIRRRGPLFPTASPIFDGFLQNGFVELAERPGRAYAIGGIGKFWRLADNQPIRTLAGPEDFMEFDQPGYLKLASCHFVLDAGPHCRILHEIRMAGTSPEATARFARYWRLIRRPSRILRKGALEAIRRSIEAGRAK
jgi:hypothetical protein